MKTCFVCNKKYKYCNGCYDDAYQPAYKSLLCSDRCNTIFNACNDYANGKITVEEAEKELRNINVTTDEKLSDMFMDSIKNIYNKAKKNKKHEKHEVVIEKNKNK